MGASQLAVTGEPEVDVRPKPESVKVKKGHLDYLDGMRALAALYVVLHHSVLEVAGADWLHPVVPPFMRPFLFGRYAVDVFIVLSGFCLMLPVVKRDYVLQGGAGLFFFKRCRRILPPYFFSMLLSLLLIITLIGGETGSIWDLSTKLTWGGFFTHMTMLHDLFWDTTAQINYVFWSISVEWRIYFLFPLLIACWWRFGPHRTTLVTVILSYGILWGLMHTRLCYVSISPQYLGMFALGMWASAVAFAQEDDRFHLARLRQRIPWSAGFLLLSALVVAMSFSRLKHPPIFVTTYGDGIAGAWAATLLIVVSVRGRLGTLAHRVLGWRPLCFIGTFAYSIYLIHAPLLQLLQRYVTIPLHLSPVAAFCFLAFVGTPLIVLVGYLFYWAFERPFAVSKPKTAAAVAPVLLPSAEAAN